MLSENIGIIYRSFACRVLVALRETVQETTAETFPDDKPCEVALAFSASNDVWQPGTATHTELIKVMSAFAALLDSDWAADWRT